MSGEARKQTIAALAERLAQTAAGSRPAPRSVAGRVSRAAPGLDGIDACFPARGLPLAAVHELWTDIGSTRPAAAGFALALAGHLASGRTGAGDLVWVYPRSLARDGGLPYGPGLMAFGQDPGRLILVETGTTLEALWAGEEALRAASQAGVVVALDGAYERHAFMASRRLELAARSGAASAFLLCMGLEAAPSAASLRWRIAPAPGRDGGAGPSAGGPAAHFSARPRWRVVLERNRLGRCGAWTVEWNHESRTLVAADADHGAVAAPLVGRAGAGEVLRSRRASA